MFKVTAVCTCSLNIWSFKHFLEYIALAIRCMHACTHARAHTHTHTYTHTHARTHAHTHTHTHTHTHMQIHLKPLNHRSINSDGGALGCFLYKTTGLAHYMNNVHKQ